MILLFKTSTINNKKYLYSTTPVKRSAAVDCSEFEMELIELAKCCSMAFVLSNMEYPEVLVMKVEDFEKEESSVGVDQEASVQNFERALAVVAAEDFVVGLDDSPPED